MRYWILYICLLSFTTGAKGQEILDFNLIILVNNELNTGIISDVHLLVKNGSEQRKIEVDYYPGNLSLMKADQQLIKTAHSDSVFIVFNHNIFCKGDHITVHFEIPFSQNWTKEPYTILKVYDLSRGKYKDVFKPINNRKNYTFEVDSQGSAVTRVMIGKIKKKRFCKK